MGRLTHGQRATGFTERTGSALRIAASANSGTDIHHSLIKIAGPALRGQLLRQLPELLLHRCLAVPAVNGVVPTKYPLDVAIKNRRPLTQTETDYRPGC